MNDNLHIKGTRTTPEVAYDSAKAEFHMRGVSIPENAWEFYRPLFDWIDKNFESGFERLSLHFHLDYFNTVSARCIVETCQRFIKFSKQKDLVAITWHYENDDQDMMESGMELSRVVNHPFKIESVPPPGSAN